MDTFYEKDGKTIKQRSLQASAKTGAFKLITEMCDLFDARPIFHGNTKTVDIIPMNPFSQPEDGGLPDVTKADGVLELNYGHNVKGLTRTLNTENIVTKLYAYGSYGDKTSGYCGVDECIHQAFIYTLTDALTAGTAYYFIPGEYSAKTFIPSSDVPAGARIVWSTLDPAASSYAWNEDSQQAYPIIGRSGTEEAFDASQELPADAEVVDEQNWFSFLMDFSYYQNVGLFADGMYNK